MSADRYTADLETRAAQDLERVQRATARAPAPPPGEEPPPQVKLLRGDSIKPEAIAWLWDGWLARGKLHVLAGAPGTGKSTIAFALAAAITAGGRWPDGSKAPRGNVLVWSGEDDPADTILPRLLAAGGDPRRVFIVAGTEHKGESRPFDPAKDMAALRHEASLVGDVALLIADPIVSAVAGDSHKNAEVRRALQPLVDLGAMLGCAVLGISHFSKGSAGRDPTERVTGSLAFAALARIVLATAKSEDGGRVLARAKSNIGPDSDGFGFDIELVPLAGDPAITATRIRWGAAIAGTARELLSDEEETPSEEVRGRCGECARWLLGQLADGPQAAHRLFDAAEGLGYEKRMVQRAKRAVGIVSKREGFGRGSQVIWFIGDETIFRDAYSAYAIHDKNPSIDDTGEVIGDNCVIGDTPALIDDIRDKATRVGETVTYARGTFDEADEVQL